MVLSIPFWCQRGPEMRSWLDNQFQCCRVYVAVVFSRSYPYCIAGAHTHTICQQHIHHWRWHRFAHVFQSVRSPWQVIPLFIWSFDRPRSCTLVTDRSKGKIWDIIGDHHFCKSQIKICKLHFGNPLAARTKRHPLNEQNLTWKKPWMFHFVRSFGPFVLCWFCRLDCGELSAEILFDRILVSSPCGDGLHSWDMELREDVSCSRGVTMVHSCSSHDNGLCFCGTFFTLSFECSYLFFKS